MRLIYCSALALVQNNQVMMATRSEGRAWDGFWEFPGGKLEVGETPEQALIREIKEELSAEIKEEDLKPLSFASLTFHEKDMHITMFLFSCHKFSGELKPMENQKYRFVSKDELATVNVPPLDKELIDVVMNLLS